MIAAELRGGNKPSLNEALGWIGWRVDDIFGAGVGRLDDVWIDPGTGEPRWLLVNAGRFGGRNTLIPFDDATAGTGHVWVPYEREIVLGAPAVEPGAPLTDQVESELHSHYTMHARSAGADSRARNAPGQLGELRYREPDPSDGLGAPPAGEAAAPPDGSMTPGPAAPAQPAAPPGAPGTAPRLPARPAPPSPASASRDPQQDGDPDPAPPVPEAADAPGPATARPAAGWQHDYSQPSGPAGSAGAAPQPGGAVSQPAEAGGPAPAHEGGRGMAPAQDDASAVAGAAGAAGVEGAARPGAEPARQMVEIQLAGNLTIRGELVNLRIFTDDPE